jgi:N-formylmaleamate deformylase
VPQERGERIFVEANGIRHALLHYEGRSPQVVVVPGITTTALGVDFLAVELQPRYEVFAIDVRGRGQSGWAGPGGYRLQDYAADLQAVVAALGLDQPVLLGLSLGARIVAAACLAARHMAGACVLAEPPLSGPGRAYPVSLAEFQRQLNESQAGTTAKRVRERYPRWPERELEIRAQELATCDPAAIAESHAGLERDEFMPGWQALRGPAVLIRGAESAVITADDVPALSRANPDIPVETVPDAAHMIPWENLPGFVETFERHV